MSNSLKGLTQDEVIRSREQYGANLLTPPKRKSLWRLFIEKFNDPVIRILLVAAVLSLGIGFIHNEFAEAIGIFCAIFLATGVAFWFEYDAMKKFDVLNSTNDDTPVKAVRDGAVAEIPKKEVVVGDIVLLESGEEVPADGILQEAVSLKINESTLTGEPQIGKTTDPAHFDKESTYPSDHVMRGTTVVEGHGVMQVTAVGDATEFGKVAEQATVESDEETPLNLATATPVEADRTRRHLAGDRHVRSADRQRYADGRLVDGRLADRRNRSVAVLHGSRHADRRGRAGRTADERHAVARGQHAADAPYE